ncbi:MAG TPA: D-isomer specific 2-hydroxyacid dehydrogenase family protein [Acidimicrobiales bacterium]|nr:D-isomer specific 2-hydroxyacid dehydrogenase family protein [Acidimicrobiales bacterium]
MGRRPRILVGPTPDEVLAGAVRAGGGVIVDGGDVDALVWHSFHMKDVAEMLAAHPGAKWVQLPMAGVESVVESGVMADPRWAGVTWTCAKGSYAKPVAEHALALGLAGLRNFVERARASHWGPPAGTSLYGADVVVLGGGGIARELLSLLAPFQVRATVLRRNSIPVMGAARTVGMGELHSALPAALVVFVALALTPETTGIIGKTELALMGSESWLVNVARGRHVRTADLVEALSARTIGGAALDVTDPEPLPSGHPLWAFPNCLITPHTADTEEMTRPLLALRVRENVELFAAGLPLVGTVDPVAGY